MIKKKKKKEEEEEEENVVFPHRFQSYLNTFKL